MKYNLADICEYAKGKVDVAILDDETYISTENMMPNKGGITSASSLPTIAQTQVFLAGDVLVSNIRPYFKKICAEFGFPILSVDATHSCRNTSRYRRTKHICVSIY